MKKNLCMLAIILVAFVATNCKKDQAPTAASSAEVQFNIQSVLEVGSLKSVMNDTIICSQAKADYVLYKIGSEPLKSIPVFYIGNIPWTSSIKLPIGQHIITEFFVMSDNNTPANTADDVLLSATPHTGSVFAGYVTTPLNQTINIAVDKKNEFKIDVVCFQPQYFQKFGFVYFYLNELTIRQQWFFGDFCIKHKSDYDNSPYSQQPGWAGNPGPYVDVPAIFKIEVWRNGVLQNTFQNSNQGEKLSVTYGDYKQPVDHFVFKMFILVKQGTSFNYVFFKSWAFDDVSNIAQGTDGVVDYFLGNCYDPANPPDLIIAPWLNLPMTAQYTITGWNPATLGAYVDASLGGITAGYDIHNGVYPSWCADHLTTISVGTLYNMDVYSSLHPELLPVFAQSAKWQKLNWLFNHLDWYAGHNWYDLQGVIWLYDNPIWDGLPLSGVPALTPLMTQMKADCETYGAGYVPPPGGFAMIIFIPTGTPPDAVNATVQTMLIQIDP